MSSLINFLGRARQFLEQRGAIVRRHLVQNGRDLFVRHRVQKVLLFLDSDIFENVGRQRGRQDAEHDDLFVFRKIENHFRDVGRRPFLEKLAQGVEIARVDQRLDFRC